MKINHTGTGRNSDALRRAFRTSMFSFGLPKADAHILTAFSGGADSTALLYLLKQLSDAQRHPFAVSAIHVHHGIRGAEADRDARFCEAFCAEYGIPLRLEYADVPALAAESGRSLEEEAREVRYRLFAQHLAKNPDITHLTTAHHADD
ncbi:MAG: tRNA lysidine(34) synthetase TilS, partial [Clostridia bacterium]|nr:tRNA lysidine(34) synthetase TilS [Clostridia bacterium]